jgi:alpha-1,2-mannosyltransferase
MARPQPGGSGPRRRRVVDVLIPVLIFGAAFVVRLLPVLRGGGLHYYGHYDDGVYYTAAEALGFGHLPYRDFVMLHPPGSTVVLLPFTLFGRLTSDPVGMTTARLAFMALGGLSAVLVYAIARGWGRTQGVVAGLIYAASAAAAYSEQATFLEPIGSVLTLVAVLALCRRTGRWATRLEVVGGLALGLSCTVKIWYAGIAVALVLVLLLRREIRAAARVAVAGVGAATIVMLPFLIAAPGRMWTMVVADQFSRTGAAKPLTERIPSIVGTQVVLADQGPSLTDAVTVLLVVLIIAAVLACLGDRDAWLLVGLFVSAAAILLASPAYFRHYGVLLAAPIALVVPIGFGRVVTRIRWPAAREGLVALAVVAVAVSGLQVAASRTGDTQPWARFAAAAPAGCIAADDPAALIQMDRLTADFRAGCDVPVDVTGASYGAAMPRAANTAFHRWLMAHLLHSEAFVVLRPNRDTLSPVERRLLHRHPVLAPGHRRSLRAGDGSS